MSLPFVAEIRTRPDVIDLAGTGSGALWHIRVQVAERWDTVLVKAPATTPVRTLKLAALREIDPSGPSPEAYETKLAGIEILNEDISLADAGAADGSTLLVILRRRRAVR
jgi:hypothetical protein